MAVAESGGTEREDARLDPADARRVPLVHVVDPERELHGDPLLDAEGGEERVLGAARAALLGSTSRKSARSALRP